jgi:hypothetical protein
MASCRAALLAWSHFLFLQAKAKAKGILSHNKKQGTEKNSKNPNSQEREKVIVPGNKAYTGGGC